MVFLSNNKCRKCKYCDLQAKKNISKNGRNKGYYRTCGSEKCLKEQYNDKFVSQAKRKLVNARNLVCACCEQQFTAVYSNHKRYCLECVPDKKWRNRARHYNVGKKQWDILLKLQNNKCALCEKNPDAVDHCHKTQVVRGLLCGYCNIQITYMDNDRDWLNRALEYIGEKK